MAYLVALLIGVIAGLRTMAAPAAVAWAAQLGWLHLEDTWLAFLGYRWTAWVLTVLAIIELITDQLPSTPSRTVPLQLGARIVSGALCGAAVGASGGSAVIGAVAGVIGALVGTYGGAAGRSRLAAALGSDRPAAFIEDAVAVVGAALLVGAGLQVGAVR